jgi:hypothetical protein
VTGSQEHQKRPLWATTSGWLFVAAVMIGACTPTKEAVMKQLGACKMQAIEKGFRDDSDYLSACMSTAGYRPSLDCIGESTKDHPKTSYLHPGCYEPITPGWLERLQTRKEVEKKEELPTGWSIRLRHPCPDSDPLGLFTDSECDPERPKKMPSLKMTKCTRERFYADAQQCM